MIVRTIPPAVEPVTLEEMRLWLRIDDDQHEEDLMIQALITGAREWVEEYLNRALITSTYEEYYSEAVLSYRLQRLDVQAIDEIAGWDEELQRYVPVLPDYINDATVHVDGIVTLTSDWLEITIQGNAIKYNWPDVGNRHNGVRITYISGYGDTPDSVPLTIKQAIMLKATALYVNRADGAHRYHDAASTMIRPYKLYYSRV